MDGFAKKVGLVRGHRIQHVDQFAASVFAVNIPVILAVGRNPKGPEPLLEAGLKHDLLARRHLDAALADDELAETGELGL